MHEKLIEVMKDTRANAAWHRWSYEESADYLIKNDVVPAVRCKDCKHYFHYGDGVYGCRTYGMMKTKPDGFCSYGERKDNGT